MSKMKQPILLIEDSPEDQEATIRAFQRCGLANPIIHCETGDEAIDYLFRRGRYSDPARSPRPGLILLDLNLPGTDGREVLGEIKKDLQLKTIPVIILTTSCEQHDIDNCYAAGANSYICKPITLASYIEAIQRFKNFWFEIAVFPKEEHV
ncbi:MAG: response regulator [Thermodesulfobacteriota bacterium]